MKKYILGIDEGTTSTRAVLYDTTKNKITDISSHAIKQYYPKNGWVEQDANQIYNAVTSSMREVLRNNNVSSEEIIGVGITNQRETIVAFNANTGEPIHKAIVWQCRRTADTIDAIPANTKEQIRKKTGLIADAYFSASKMKWIMDNVPEAKNLAKQGLLRMGTIDAYLAYKLTGNFVTDTTNASRTMLFNINTLSWDEELIKYFGLTKEMLPTVISSNQTVGTINILGDVELCALVGDQQSSLLGQGCIKRGMAKNTYGTGAFILMNIGDKPSVSCKNLLTTVALTVNKKTMYALEGSIFSVSSAINWLKSNLKLFSDFSVLEKLAYDIPNNQGVYFVPAFTGLGAPYWKPNTRGTITGLTLDSDNRHIIRAVLESIAYNTKAIVDNMNEIGISLNELRVDGGACKNNFLMQFQADMLNTQVKRLSNSEATAMGAIFLVGINKKLYKLTDIPKLIQMGDNFKPHMKDDERYLLYKGWIKAVKQTIQE